MNPDTNRIELPPGQQTVEQKRGGRHWPALLGLLALVASVFRRHLSGEALFLGNFDRLNSFLNTLWLQVQGWKLGHLSGWDESMLMGRNLYALPFTYPNPFNYLVSLFPGTEFYWVAGLVTILLHTLAGWCAYWFIHEVCRDRWAAFCGAVIYQFSALAVLKISQNDMSFAVLIDIPLMLLAIRRLDQSRFARGFLALTAILCHLLIFCFLQKVAYALLLAGFYAITLSWGRRSWRPVLTLAAAGLIAIIAAFPRIYGIMQELKTLQRQISPDFDMQNFAALYHWQNFKAFDVWRWFNDGLFGRFFSEAFALHNNFNITEGMLLFSGMLTPFLILGGLLCWEGVLGRTFSQGHGGSPVVLPAHCSGPRRCGEHGGLPGVLGAVHAAGFHPHPFHHRRPPATKHLGRVDHCPVAANHRPGRDQRPDGGRTGSGRRRMRWRVLLFRPAGIHGRGWPDHILGRCPPHPDSRVFRDHAAGGRPPTHEGNAGRVDECRDS